MARWKEGDLVVVFCQTRVWFTEKFGLGHPHADLRWGDIVWVLCEPSGGTGRVAVLTHLGPGYIFSYFYDEASEA